MIKYGGIGFILGILASAIVVIFLAPKYPKATTGGISPLVKDKTQEAETRTVYVYRDVKPPKGSKPGSVVLTGVNTETGTATAVLDQDGRTSISIVTNPLPWIAKSSKWTGGLYAGYRGSEFVYRATIARDLIQVKRLHLGVQVSGDFGANDNRLFAGIGVRF